MSRTHRDLSCPAKLALVVLDNCGPLSPSEVADEARLSHEEADRAVRTLVEEDLAEPVCGVCGAREQVYALTDDAPTGQRSP